MRVIITGGTGLIGGALARDMAADGYEVIVLSRSPQAARGLAAGLPAGVTVAEWDGKTSAGWGHFADGADAIVNLAGESIAGTGLIPARWTAARKQRIVQSRLDAAHAVVQAVEQAAVKPRVVIQSSAVGYYGPAGDEIVTEAHAAGDDFLARTCVQWEESTAAVEGMGVRRVLVRTGLVLSADGGVFPTLVLPFRFFVGGSLGSGRQWYPWIHIEDEVGAIRFLIEKDDARGVYNLSAPNPLRNAEFSRVIGQVMGRPSLIPVPEFVFRLAFGEMATLVVDGQRAIPQRLEEMGYRFQFGEASVALRDLLK